MPPKTPFLSFSKVAKTFVVKEGDMKTPSWNGLIQTLVLVRLGQELGTDSQLARAVHELLTAVLTIAR